MVTDARLALKDLNLTFKFTSVKAESRRSSWYRASPTEAMMASRRRSRARIQRMEMRWNSRVTSTETTRINPAARSIDV